MSARTTPPTVTLTRSGPYLLVSPLVPLIGALRAGRLEAAEGGTDLLLAEQALFGFRSTIHDEQQAVVWVGLEPVVRGLLKAHNMPYIAADDAVTAAGTSFTGEVNTNGVFTSPDAGGATAVAADTGTATSGPGTTRGFGGTRVSPSVAEAVADPAVVSFAAGVRRGLVRHGAAVDVLRVVAELSSAFANADLSKKVVVVARTRAAAGRLDRLLRELGVEAALMTGQYHSESRRVTVCTLGAATRAGVERADVILVEDALHSTWVDPLTEAPVPHVVFLAPRRPRGAGRDPRLPPAVGLMDCLRPAGTSAVVIGFLPQSRHLSPFERARVWQVCGCAELVVPRHGAVERPVVTAVTNRLNLRRSIRAGADEVAAKKALWHDPLRNRVRAKLARALKEGSPHLLMTFSGVPAALPDTAPRAVLLLCEGIDQAQAVRKTLPDWPLVSGLDHAAGDVEAAVANPAGGVIATALGTEKLSGSGFDVVVRCDPGRGLPPLPEGWLETSEPNPRPLLVADIADEGHHLPALWSRMRKRAYLAAGWARAGADPDVTAWERFRALVLDREERP